MVMLALLLLVVLGLLSLSSVATRGASQIDARAAAEANARFAMMQAIGQLQESAGPDQRITATVSLLDGTSANHAWTGVWNNQEPNKAPVWLVSGAAPDPAVTLAESSSASFLSASPGHAAVRAELVELKQGGYAYWIGDEGVKARVNIAAPEDSGGANPERLTRSQTPQEPGLGHLGGPWTAEKFGIAGSVPRTKLISIATAAIATAEADLPRTYFHDLTTGGYGLPVNVTRGGLKVDLSVLFDRSQQSNSAAWLRYLGGQPTALTSADADQVGDAQVSRFQIDNANAGKFYLGPLYATTQAGPNWGILFNYASMWRNVDQSQQAPMVPAIPRVETDLRSESFLPYSNAGSAEWSRDRQHLNSPLTPVVYLIQAGFRMRSELIPNTDPRKYKAQLELKPVVGFWNPYNVAIKAKSYDFDWALYPYLRFNYGPSSLTGNQLTPVHLREYWANKTGGVGYLPTDANPQGGSWIRMRTPSVDFEPGEFRIFSFTEPNINIANTNTVKPGWNEKGALLIDLRVPNPAGGLGAVREVPEGNLAWFGDVFMQDTHSQDTLNRFPNLKADASATWIGVKSGTGTAETVLARHSNFWNGGTRSQHLQGTPKPFVPERIGSAFVTGVGTTKTTHRIQDLAQRNAAGDPTRVAHIGTWAFNLRSSTDMGGPDVGQSLRGWVDSNPRALASSPRFDGSKVASTGLEGWNFTAAYMGGNHSPGMPPPPFGTLGDGKGGYRGLVGEDGLGIREPQFDPAGGRCRGYGGPSNTAATGQTHVILYDVPRTPLLSVGQFQHAQLSRYNFEPGFAFGNSYANPRIPPAALEATNFAGISGLRIIDISQQTNLAIWDGFFFSSLGIDYRDRSNSPATSFDQVFAPGAQRLPNPRMFFSPLPGEGSIDAILAKAGERAPEAIAARTYIEGAFNVNSTSVTAWKAVLASMAASHLPIINPATKAVSWVRPEGIRFNRFGHVIADAPYQTSDSGTDPSFWQGWRKLSDSELDALATAIVKQVRERGPFRSMAAFVNRNPLGTPAQQHSGALQAAIDSIAQPNLPADVGLPSGSPAGPYHPPVGVANQAAGHAGYLLQGDLLQSLGPLLQVRSDSFRIRTYGESRDVKGKVLARAWCEVFVQRTAEYIDPADAPHVSTAAGDTLTPANQRFGRRFKIVSFRWLDPAEI